jgi:hypothetical protein
MSDNLQALETQTSAELNKLKSEFASKLDTIQGFVDSFTEEGGVPGAYTDAVSITIASVDSLQSALDGITFNTPNRPAGLEANQPEKYKTHVWEAWQIDGLENKLMNIVQISDTGILKELSAVNITTDFQEALYNYQRTNDIRDLEYELDVLDGKWAADGYVLPPDALVHNRSWLVARFDEKRTDRTRNIFSEIAKLAQQNVQWAYENGIKIEQLHADFAIQYAKIFKDIIEAIVAVYKADVEIAIAQLEAEIKKLQAEIEVAKLEISRDETEMKLKVDQANSRLGSFVSAYGASIQANTTNTGHRITAATNVANGYQAIFSAWGGRYTGLNVQTNKRS